MEKIKWFKTPYSLCEESQETGMIFSFVTKKGLQCHPWIKCRDFLQDAVMSTLTKRKCDIYGFKFDVKVNPVVETTQTLLLVSQQALLNIPNKDMPKPELFEFYNKMKSALKLINHYEKSVGEECSKVTMLRDRTKWFWIFSGPSFWMKSPALISTYSYLIRLGDKQIQFTSEEELLEQYEELIRLASKDRDVEYLKTCWNKLATVIKKAKEILLEGGDFDKDYFAGHTVTLMHSRGGIRSLCKEPCVYLNTNKAALLFKNLKEEVV